MNWDEIVANITKYIVKVETPMGFGTGFLCLYNENKYMCGIATANHVVEYANKWQQPIKITYDNPVHARLLKPGDYFEWDYKNLDTAIIIFPKQDFPFPPESPKLLPFEETIAIGKEVGWLGYPNIAANTLCFFSGTISALIPDRQAYLIDGVAINGVSGGPVLSSTTTKGLEIVGIITAYQANLQRGDVLPGLSIAQDVSGLHGAIGGVKSVDEARNKKESIDGKTPDQIPPSEE